MAIPGMKPDFPVRGKVRIGEKGKTASGKEYPKSLDYFVSEDEDFKRLTGEQPKSLRVRFLFAGVEDNFSTGMEFWRRNQLACYTKDSGSDPVALRVPSLVKETDVLRGEPLKSGRQPIACPFRECEFFKSKDCKPIGRLVFLLEGGNPSAGVWQLDTKSWNSIEELTGAFALFGDPRGRTFELSVRMEQRGRDRFPLLSLSEVDVEVRNETDLAKADALVALRAMVDAGEDVPSLRAGLARALDQTNPGWKEDALIVDRIKRVGAHAAVVKLLGKYGL